MAYGRRASDRWQLEKSSVPLEVAEAADHEILAACGGVGLAAVLALLLETHLAQALRKAWL